MVLRNAAVAVIVIAGVSAAQAWPQDLVEAARAKAKEADAAFQTMPAPPAGSGDVATVNENVARGKVLIQEAKSLYIASGVEHSNDYPLLTEYAQLLYRAGDGDLSADILRKVAENGPARGNAWLNLGRVLAALGPAREREALEALSKALTFDLEPANASSAYTESGLLYWKLGLFELADEAFRSALAQLPANTRARQGKAAVQVRQGYMAEAARELEGLTGMTPDETVYLRGLLSKALDDFLEARLSFPDRAEHHAGFAKILLWAGRLAGSTAPLERALQLDDSDYVSWNLLGSVSRQLGKTARAREAFRKSLELNPDQPRTHQVLEELAESSVDTAQ